MQKRFRKAEGDRAAEVWLDVGLFRFKAELYEDGVLLDTQKGARSSKEEIKVYLSGKDFSALLRLETSGNIVCTWSR
jgi:hypothetical protein